MGELYDIQNVVSNIDCFERSYVMPRHQFADIVRRIYQNENFILWAHVGGYYTGKDRDEYVSDLDINEKLAQWFSTDKCKHYISGNTVLVICKDINKE